MIATWKKMLFLVTLTTAAGTALAADVVKQVPQQFLGVWNSKVQDCGTGDNDSSLTIRTTSVEYYESSGPIKAIVTHGRYEIAFVTELSGEGQTWLSTAQFKLSPDEQRLIYTADSGEDFIRFRCPAKRRTAAH